jgi:hypothetical protein
MDEGAGIRVTTEVVVPDRLRCAPSNLEQETKLGAYVSKLSYEKLLQILHFLLTTPSLRQWNFRTSTQQELISETPSHKCRYP